MPLSSGVRHRGLLLVLIAATLLPGGLFPFSCHGFSTRAASSSKAGATQTTHRGGDNNNNVLILDHINMNHGKGRHDWIKSFYGEDFLGCAWDPRKAKNLETGRKTLWANLGAHQFHLPEGSPDAQVLNGFLTIVHPSPEKLLERFAVIRSSDTDSSSSSCLNESLFDVEVAASPEDLSKNTLIVTDPWGSIFRIVAETNGSGRDPRGSQPGECSEGSAISDLTIHVPVDANLQGIGRFYEEILGATVAPNHDEKEMKIQMGPFQTLTFLPKETVGVDTHVELREIPEENDNEDASNEIAGTSTHLGNYGVHISLYVADLPSSYQKARNLGLAYVNKRFSRRAYTLEEAIDDCMFRCLDIVDPLNPEDGPILRLEHEVRSVLKKDGSKYKSCPFDEIPEACMTL